MEATIDRDLLHEADERPEGFALPVARHRGRLLRYATRRLGPAHAEDIVNETFAIAFTPRAGFQRERTDAGT